MKKQLTTLLTILIMVLFFSNLSAQTTIVEWTFEGDVVTPSSGSGSLLLIGGTTATFATGNGGGRGWNTTTYPAQGTNPKTAGIQIEFSTVGFTNIQINWDHRHSNTSANHVVLQYTLDVVVGDPIWYDAQAYFANAGDTWFPRAADFSSLTGLNNNPNAAFRIVSDFTTETEYVASNPASTYGGGTWRFDNIIITGTTANPVLEVNPNTLSGFTYVFGSGPSASQSYTLSGANLSGSGNIAVTAPTSYEVSLDNSAFASALNVSYSGGEITSQPVAVYVRLKAGLAVGDYNGEVITNTGGGADEQTVTCDGSVTAADLPGLTEVILPQFIQGLNGTNNNRVPYVFRVTLFNLLPNAAYRFINQVITSADGPTTNGAGNVIYVNADNTFTRTSSPSLTDAGPYGQFTTDASGSYTGWFITEPTGNARFTPGNEIFMRIRLNDGADGTVAVTYLTTTNTVKVLDFGTENNPNQCTAILGLSGSPEKNFLFLYDYEAGSGRPISGAIIESDEVDLSGVTSIAQFYRDHVDNIDGAWGTIIPNQLPNGIKRIERRELADGSIFPLVATDDNGIWPSGANTVNPTGGLTPIQITITDAPVPVELTSFAALVQDGVVELKWTTATETNNLGFEVQRKSSDDFSAIGFVKGMGTTTQQQNYSFIDNDIGNSKYSYRLMQIDFDGSFTFSQVIEVYAEVLPAVFKLYQNHPNPFNPVTKIKYTIPSGSIFSNGAENVLVTLKVYDILGREIQTLINEEKTAGTYEVLWEVKNLTSGMYICQLRAGTFVESIKMLMMK